MPFPNWQFVAVVASFELLMFVVEACVFLLVTGHINLRFFLAFGVLFSVAFTGGQAWKRWK